MHEDSFDTQTRFAILLAQNVSFFSKQFFPYTPAALIALSSITNTNLCCESNVENLGLFASIFSSSIFPKKFSFSDGAVFEIFAIDKQNAFVAKGNLNFNVTIEMITIQKSIIVNWMIEKKQGWQLHRWLLRFLLHNKTEMQCRVKH